MFLMFVVIALYGACLSRSTIAGGTPFMPVQRPKHARSTCLGSSHECHGPMGMGLSFFAADIVFVPEVDFATLKDPSIIDAF